MAEPQSPNHVFDFPKDDPALNEEEFEAEPEEDPEKDPEEEPEEAQEMDVDVEVVLNDEMNEPELIFPYEGVGSPDPPPLESDTSSDSEPEIATSATVGMVTQVPFTGRRFPGIYARGGHHLMPLQMSIQADTEFLTLKRIKEGLQRMDAFD
ncbi:hypothetical protein Tco_0154629 [Tanacetum coccineum]